VEPDPLVLEFRDDGGDVFRGAVVHDDEFPVGERLSDDRADHLPQPFGLVQDAQQIETFGKQSP
jgi:hypothetical protein